MAGSACFYLFVKEFSFSSVILEWKTLKSVIKSKPEKDFGNKQALFQAKVDNIESIVTYLRSKSICLSKPEEFRVIRVVSLICGLLGWVLRVGESFRKTKIHGHISALALWCWCYRIQLCCWRGVYVSYMSKFIFLTHSLSVGALISVHRIAVILSWRFCFRKRVEIQVQVFLIAAV